MRITAQIGSEVNQRHDANSPTDGVEAHLVTRRAGWLAIVHALLIVAAFLLMSRAPGPLATGDDYAEFYSSGDSGLLVIAGLYLMPFAGIAFMWFIVVLRMWIAQTSNRLDELFSGVQFVSGLVYLAIFFAGAATVSVVGQNPPELSDSTDPGAVRHFMVLGWSLMLVFAMRMAAVFVLTTTTLGRRRQLLPAWFVGFGYLVGLFLLLSASISPSLVLVLPGWLLLLGMLLLNWSRSLRSGIQPGLVN